MRLHLKGAKIKSPLTTTIEGKLDTNLISTIGSAITIITAIFALHGWTYRQLASKIESLDKDVRASNKKGLEQDKRIDCLYSTMMALIDKIRP